MIKTNKVEIKPEEQVITRGALPAEPKVVAKKASLPKPEVVTKDASLGFETIQPVSFNINGKLFEGTKFSFENKELAEDRKQMLIKSYGEGIII